MSVAPETQSGTTRLLELIDQTVAPEKAAAVKAFAQAYLRRLSGDASEGISVEDLLAEVVGAFEFASGRDGAEIAVRAFNPTRAEHGYEPLGSVVETNTDDWPFLVDSVSAELDGRGLAVTRLLHPIIGGGERPAAGGIAGIGAARAARRRESVIDVALARRLPDDDLPALEQAIKSALQAVQLVVADFPEMRDRVDDMVTVARAGTVRYPRDEVHEVADFLEWLLHGNFVLVGAREYDFSGGAIRAVEGSGLGILRNEERSAFARPVPISELPEGIRRRATSGDLLIVDKTNARSPVHRRARMDYIGVRRLTPRGAITGELRLLGLFTSKA